MAIDLRGKYLSAGQAAVLLGVSRQSVDLMIKRGRLVPTLIVPPLGHPLFARGEVIRLKKLREQRQREREEKRRRRQLRQGKLARRAWPREKHCWAGPRERAERSCHRPKRVHVFLTINVYRVASTRVNV